MRSCGLLIFKLDDLAVGRVTSVAKVTNILLVTLWMATRAPGSVDCSRTGSTDNCEIPASFSTRLVIWLLTWDDQQLRNAPVELDLPPRLPTFLKAIRLMISKEATKGQAWIRMHVIGGSPEVHLNVVLIDGCVHSHIQHWLGPRTIGEINGPALQLVAIARED
jgi:hypothetical protein